MEKYLKDWRTSILSESNPLLLNEGLFHLGLPASVAEAINRDFEGVPEKGKTIIGNLFKKQVFNNLTRGYAMPLMNNIVSLSDQIFESTLDLFNNDIRGDEALSAQMSMAYPGGKRLAVNESVSHRDIITKWKEFKGF